MNLSLLIPLLVFLGLNHTNSSIINMVDSVRNAFGNFSVEDVPLVQLPSGILSTLNFNPLSVKDVAEFIPGWGMFDLGSEVNHVIFTLRNRKGNYTEQFLIPRNIESFKESSWDTNEQTIIVIHGYTEDGNDNSFSSTKKIITAYVEAKRPENLIFVDWHPLSRQLNYFRSANNTEIVGLYTAELIIFLHNFSYLKSLRDLHIVGFSLGAHCAGIASHYAGMFLNEKVARVTGLDPAGPGFTGNDVSLESRLDETDASFVDVIHTNMGTLLTTFGTPIKSGHVDFYPNGGEHQPGCSSRFFGEIIGICSHNKAPEYFSRSILGEKFTSFPCSSYQNFLKGYCSYSTSILMGEFVSKWALGDYFSTVSKL